MPSRFEELDWQRTPIGDISLRRRIEPTLGVDVYEVKLGDEFLMSSLFTVAEEELARLGLAQSTADHIDVLVGGLGLGYTAVAALADPRVSKLIVVDAVAPVIDWHRRELLPDAVGLAADSRVQLIEGDFFQAIAQSSPLAQEAPMQFGAILLDIDHSPEHVLHPSHADFYETDGLKRLLNWMTPDGIFALWSDDPPDDGFTTRLAEVFTTVAAHVVEFPNPLTRGTSANTVYIAQR